MPRGVNDWGEIVGRADVGGAVHGYLFSDGHFVLIDFPGASNARSEIVGQYIYRQQRPHPRPERAKAEYAKLE